MLGMALWTADAREAALKPATTQELLYGTDHNRPQGARARLEAFLVTADVTFEVVFKEPIELCLLGVSGTIHGGRVRNAWIVRQPGGIGAFSSPRRFPRRHKTSAACQDEP